MKVSNSDVNKLIFEHFFEVMYVCFELIQVNHESLSISVALTGQRTLIIILLLTLSREKNCENVFFEAIFSFFRIRMRRNILLK